MLGESHSKKKYILYDSIYIQFRNSQKLRVKSSGDYSRREEDREGCCLEESKREPIKVLEMF